VTAILGSGVIAALIKSREVSMQRKHGQREKLIQDSKFFISKVSNMGYANIGDFRNEMIYINLLQYLSKTLQSDLSSLVIGLRAGTVENTVAHAESEKFNILMSNIKTEIATLEDKWLRK
jgi:hypothetical protein